MSHYLRNNVHMTTSGNFSDPALQCTVAEMGIDRLMFAVDYPMEVMNAGTEWFDNTPVLSDEERRKVGRTNAARLFKLERFL